MSKKKGVITHEAKSEEKFAKTSRILLILDSTQKFNNQNKIFDENQGFVML